MLVWIIPIVILIVVTPIINWRYSRHLRGWPRVGLCVFAFLVMVPLPFLVPAELPLVRFAIFLVLGAGFFKIVETAWGRITQPEMAANYLRYCCWHFVPQDTGWAMDDDARRACRQSAIKQSCIVFFNVVGLVVLLWINGRVDLHSNLWLSTFWMIWVFLFTVDSVWRLGSVPLLWFGVQVSDLLVWPPLARSPRDFWSRRWNLWFKNFMHRNLFQPLGGRERPIRSMSVVWLVSAIVHEYLIFVCLGTHGAYMFTFFLIHGLASYVEVWWSQRRPEQTPMASPVAVALHLAWFVVTAPLFFMPINALTQMSKWQIF